MDIFAYSMLCFTSLFTLMDPLGVMPVFLQMTEGMSAGERRSIALKSCALTFVILVLFTLCGRFLFHFFGISTNGFRIAGGIIIFKIGYDTAGTLHPCETEREREKRIFQEHHRHASCRSDAVRSGCNFKRHNTDGRCP